MDIEINIKDRMIKEPTILFCKISDNENFPAACIGEDSYIWRGTINTGIPFTIKKGYAVHNLQFGKFDSVALGAEFCMGINHNYLNLTMGVSDLFQNTDNAECKYRQKGQILIQNDVWLGHNVTVMPGVIIHNGAVVAANSHVVKDVPPYAIVGGNPAEVIKYRFDREIIDKLLTIQWWNWSDEKIQANSRYFYSENVSEFYQEALNERQNTADLNISRLNHTYLFFPDFFDAYCIWKRVISEFIAKFKNSSDHLLILYIDKRYEDNDKKLVNMINEYAHESLNSVSAMCKIKIFINTKKNEKAIFKYVDYYIASRNKDTILHSCYADENNVKVISGVDVPIF